MVAQIPVTEETYIRYFGSVELAGDTPNPDRHSSAHGPRGRVRRRRHGVRRTVAMAVAMAVAAVGAVAVTPAAVAAPPDRLNPFAMNGGFTVYAREDATLANAETEGSIAVGGIATKPGGGQYSIIHVAAGTADYTLPTVDGDPARLLVGAYAADSGGITAITSAGTDDPSLFGDLKMVDRSGPWQASARADWLRLNLNAANADQTPVIDATNQQYPLDAAPPASTAGAGSIYTVDTSETAVAGYVEANAEATYDDAQLCLDDLASGATGTAVGVAENYGDRVVLDTLSLDDTNVVDYADIAGAALIQFSAGSPTPGAENPLVIRVPAGTTSVVGARSDPQGAYSPYIFWDLSALSGPVEMTAAQGRIDGSIYAPSADLSVEAAPLDGQVLGQNVTLLGGEVHSYLFAGTLACASTPVGTFGVQKQLDGISAADLPAGTTFTVNYTATEPDGTVTTDSLELPADGTVAPAGADFPVGTTVEFAEVEPVTVPGFTWTGADIAPSTITIGDGATPTIAVTNTAVADATGTFSVTKAVAGLPAGTPLGGSATVGWAAFFEGAGVGAGTLSVPLDGTAVPVGEQFPLGTRVLLVENRAGLPEIPGYRWAGASWSPGRVFQITAADTDVAATVTNAVVPDTAPPSVSIVKSIEDPALAAYDYTLSYGTDPAAGPDTTVPLPVDAPATLTGLDPDAGSLILQEGPPTVAGAAVDTSGWDDPVYRITTDAGVQEISAPWGEAVEISPVPTGDIAIEVVNGVREGTFTLSKEYAGISGARVPERIGFSVAWTAALPGGETWDGVMRVPANGTPASPMSASGEPVQFPFGTSVTFAELTPAAVPGITWDAVEISPDPLVIGAGGAASVSATMTNSASLDSGTFLVSKALEGITPDELLIDEFTIDYTALVPFSGIQTGSFTIPVDGTSAGPVDAGGDPVEFPIGTVVRLSEVDPGAGALPPTAEWAGASWSPSNYVVIRGDSTAQVEVTNSVERNTRYSIVKSVDGDAAGDVPAGTSFLVDWWLDGVPQTQLALTPGAAVTSGWIPVGSIVEAAEAELPELTGAGWEAPEWTIDGEPVVPGSDGRVVVPSAAIGDISTVNVVLTNTASRTPAAAFSVTKTVTGAAAADVPETTEYELEYSVDDGEVQTATLMAGGTLSVADVPAGSTLRIRELAAAVDGVTWAAPAWTLDAAALTVDADGWVTVTLAAGETVALDLVNTALPADLPVTGGGAGWAAALVGGLLVALGGAVLLLRRRTPRVLDR